MSNIHFIKAPCHQSNRKQGFQFGPDFIKEKYDLILEHDRDFLVTFKKNRDKFLVQRFIGSGSGVSFLLYVKGKKFHRYRFIDFRKRRENTNFL